MTSFFFCLGLARLASVCAAALMRIQLAIMARFFPCALSGVVKLVPL